MFYLGKIKIYNTDEHPFDKLVLIEHQDKKTLKEKFAKSIADLFFPEINQTEINSDFSKIIFGQNQAMIDVIDIESINEQTFSLNSNKLINLSA